MKKILLISALFFVFINCKAQCFVAILDTGSSERTALMFGSPNSLSDTGYIQPVTFNVICKGLNWKGFENTETISVYIPNGYTILQTEGYVLEKVESYISKNYPSY